MKKKPNYKLNSSDLALVNEEYLKDYKDILNESIKYESTANPQITEFIDELVDLGYYPFITEVFKNTDFKPPILETFDENILWIKMAQKELCYFEETFEQEVVQEIKEKLEYFYTIL